MDKSQKRVVDYYLSPESRLGYTFFTWDTKHFGYYPSKKRDISEKEAQRLMMDLLAQKLQLKKTDLVLDAGCGRGTTSCYLAKEYNAKVIGIDIVPFEIEIAKHKIRELNLSEKVNFYLRDYSFTKFPDNYFDKVFTLETLVHSPNLEKTLKEFNRILKPKGKLGLFEYSVSTSGKFNLWEKKMINLIIKGSAMMSLKKMLHNKVQIYINKAGFKIISDEDITSHITPSLARFNSYAKIPYQFIKFFHLQKHFINTTAAVEFYKMAKRGLGKYRVIVAEKPSSFIPS